MTRHRPCGFNSSMIFASAYQLANDVGHFCVVDFRICVVVQHIECKASVAAERQTVIGSSETMVFLGRSSMTKVVLVRPMKRKSSPLSLRNLG